MKVFNKVAAQGDMMIREIKSLPEGVKSVQAEGGNFILTHSETGHHHVLKEQEGVEFYANQNNPLIGYVKITPKAKMECVVKHLRDFDTHESIMLKSPDDVKKDHTRVYEIRRQREYTPEGFRKAQD